MNILETQELTKQYGKYTAVDHLNLNVRKGQLVALLGPNGAGKSTTINMLIGAIKPTSGSITFGHNKSIGVVFQNSVLDGELTVWDNLKFRAGMYKHSQISKDNQLIKDLGIGSFISKKYGVLSGGQKRRVDIARALINDPELLILDEPSTGLDIQTRNKIWDVLNHLRTERNLTIILTTHYLEEVEQADYVYIVDHGKVIAEDTVSHLKQRYAQNRLYLTSAKTADVRNQLEGEFQIESSGERLKINIENDQSCLTLLNKISPLITSFEYYHGTMDDIFVNLTGKEIR